MVAVLVTAAALTACRGEAHTAAEEHSPGAVGATGATGVAPVTFTADGARRVDLQTAVAAADGPWTVVEHAALLYDKVGATWVYTAPEPLRFLRAKVEVGRVDGDRVRLTGIAPGTRVVTTGATQVWGTELHISGSH